MPVSADGVIGWDVGGAHLKAASLDASGQLTRVIQLPCPLWKGLSELQHCVRAVLLKWRPQATLHAVTMTGESADLFPSRAAGVAEIVELMTVELQPKPVRFFAGAQGFLSAERTLRQVEQIASNNWLATANFLAHRIPEGLLVDIGSTTADIIPIRGGQVLAHGRNDYERMQLKELVYSGIVRTPVMAITRDTEFQGHQVPIVAEIFATTADIYRLTGELPRDADLYPTADSAAKTEQASARRLARMIGLDSASLPLRAWRDLAGTLAAVQLDSYESAVKAVSSRSRLSARATLIGAGSGRFLVARLARNLGRKFVDMNSLVRVNDGISGNPSDCAPAVSVGWLAQQM